MSEYVFTSATDGSSLESCIGFPGTTSSVAMSPDASTFAFVLLDALGNPDNAINVVDIDTGATQTFELVSPTYDGVDSIEVLRADALDFTADNRFVVYDAFNELSFSDGSALGLWSIYAIDLATETTLALIPPTVDSDGDPLDIAFPSIAQTSDGHITFDVLDGTASQNFVFAGNLFTGDLAVIGSTTTYATPGYTGDDSGIVYSVSDLATPTLFSLVHRQVAGDRITPIGSAQGWLADADYGVIYRRGTYSGPRRVDVAVSQSVTTEPGHRAVFRVDVTNLGPDAATAVRLADTLPAGVMNVSVSQSNAACTVLPAGNEVSCDLSELQPGAIETIEITAEVQSASPLTNSMTAFASEPDVDASDNTSFSTAAAASLNVAPTVQSPIGVRTARIGSAFSLGVASSFADEDGDALSFVATGLPVGLAIDAASGTISGAPAAGSDRAAPYVVEISASDTFGGSAAASLSLTVEAAPAPAPEAAAPRAEVAAAAPWIR